jgi:G3E family GTPase
MSNWCVLDSVITTADAAHLVTQIGEHTEAISQIAFADRVVLTKGDLVSASQLSGVKNEIRRHNQHGELIEVRNGEISATALFGVQSRDGKANVAHLEEVMRRISAHSQDHDHGHGGGHHHVHTPAVKAFAIVDAGEIEWARFNSWFRDLRIKHGDDLLRVKGILDIRGETKPVVVHGVRHIFHPPSALESWTGIERGSRLVFIIRGAGLEDLIKQSFIRDVGSDGARVK